MLIFSVSFLEPNSNIHSPGQRTKGPDEAAQDEDENEDEARNKDEDEDEDEGNVHNTS